MMFGTRSNESAYGTSRIAMDKNNCLVMERLIAVLMTVLFLIIVLEIQLWIMLKRLAVVILSQAGKYYYGSHYGNKASGRNVNTQLIHIGVKNKPVILLTMIRTMVARILTLVQ